MALNKCTYCDGVTVIKAENMNDIQDAICDLERDAAEVPQLFAGALKGTAAGELVTLRDVSPVGHEVVVQVSNPTAKVRVMGKNLLNCGTVELSEMKTVMKKTDASLPAGTYTFSATITSTDTNSSSNESGVGFELADGTIEMKMAKRGTRSSITFNATQTIVQVHIYAGMNYPQSVGDTATYADCQLERGASATEYEPYKTPVEYPQGAPISSVYPSMTVTTDTAGALVNVEYNRDINIAFNDLLARISAMEAAVVSNT